MATRATHESRRSRLVSLSAFLSRPCSSEGDDPIYIGARNRQAVLSSKLPIRLPRRGQREEKASPPCAECLWRPAHSARESVVSVIVLLCRPQRGECLRFRVAPPLSRPCPLGSEPVPSLSVEEHEPVVLYPYIHRFRLVYARQAAGECREYCKGKREPG